MSTPSPARRRSFPDSMVLIFGMIILAQALTYVLPPGEYEQREGSRDIVPGTYRHLENVEPVPFHAAISAIPRGLQAASDIIFFVFIVGGVTGILRETGAIDALIRKSIDGLGSRPSLLILGLLALFAVGSSVVGMAEEYMPFIPILVTLCLALKLDAMVAVGIVYAGAGVGYGCAALNPFTVITAQKISGVPVASGAGFRWILLGICVLVAFVHLRRYAMRIRRQPELSLTADIDYSRGFEVPEAVPLTWNRAAVLLAFVAGMVLFTWGAADPEKQWYLSELATIFLALGLTSSLFGALTPNRAARAFTTGAAEMTGTALLIGLARTIEVILGEGKVIHTVVHGLAGPLNELGQEGAAAGMLAVQSVCNLFIPSGSGQAYVTMPIMAPLADVTGIPRQVAILAYQFGDGFTNMIVPTNALLMGMLLLARIPFQRWVRFILPLLLQLLVVALVALVIALRIFPPAG